MGRRHLIPLTEGGVDHAPVREGPVGWEELPLHSSVSRGGACVVVWRGLVVGGRGFMFGGRGFVVLAVRGRGFGGGQSDGS